MSTMTSGESRLMISVMMPGWNAERHLKQAVESIQGQTYTDWELIFVDDGSTDGTRALIIAMAEKDSRIKPRSITHTGRGVARNECIAHVRGKYVAVCDADDICLRDRFEKQIAFLERNREIGVVGSWYFAFSGESPGAHERLARTPAEPDEIASSFNRNKMRFHNATAMIRTNLFHQFGSYNVELRRAQDYEFFQRLHKGGVRFAAITEPLIYYRQNNIIPDFAYFVENGMFMKYADKILGGYGQRFSTFSQSSSGKSWRIYYTAKYAYFLMKMRWLEVLHRLATQK